MSKENAIRLKKLPNSTTYIRPDMTAEFSHYALMLDVTSRRLFQMSFSDANQFSKFFKGNTIRRSSVSYGYRCIVAKPHLTLKKTEWNSNLNEIFENLNIVTPLYDAERYPLLLHPAQRIKSSIATTQENNIFIEETFFGPIYPTNNIQILSLNFTKTLALTCAGVECVS